MNDADKKLKILNDGHMAALAAATIGGLITEFKIKKMLELTQNFRMGKIDQATLLASVAGLCALDDLENEMKRKITKGQIVSNEIHSKEQLT